MPKLLRPYIPLEVRCRVALRQLGSTPKQIDENCAAVGISGGHGFTVYLSILLPRLANKLSCAADDLQLDHDPALENRQKIVSMDQIGYHPDANDPDFLIYREKHAHHIKTNVRGDHGQFADNVIAKRERKRQRKIKGVRPLKRGVGFGRKSKVSSRSKWPAGRKLQSRNTLRRKP